MVLERLSECIPFIENLSFVIYDKELKNENNLIFTRKLHTVISRNIIELKLFRLACAIDIRLLSHLLRLSLTCRLDIDPKMHDALVISSDIIQIVCIDRLKPLATFILSI